ncbi:MAG: TonB-dependent siderophore receptor [Cyanobacteria bacterium CRU_2_1]|nr:TonB-dependent siderophore receptor [Cyanobacteria bacterium CRU_2_1]
MIKYCMGMSAAGMMGLLLFQPAYALESQETSNEEVVVEETSLLMTQPTPLSEIEQPYTTVSEWLEAQAESAIAITNIQLNSTETGVEVVLETQGQVTPTTSTVGNALIVEIPNAVLTGDRFEQAEPAEGIALITAESLPGNRVRVAITGTEAPPTATVRSETQSLTVSVTPGIERADETEDAIAIVVTGEREEGYLAPDASTATRIPLPLEDIPQSIQIVPRQVIEDRNVVQLTDLAENVSGVQPERGYGGITSPGFRIRGFLTNFESLRNGFPDYGYFSPRDLANVERLEILKGPAAVLYGGSPTQFAGGSGVINTITEQPLSEPFYEASMNVGSYEFYRPTIDITGPLTDDEALLYRLNVAYENADSFRDFVETESFFVAPVLTWNINSRTQFTVEANYQEYDFTFDQGFPLIPESLELPRDRYLGEPSFSNGDVDSTWVSYNLTHELNDDWRLRQGFNYTRSNLNDAQQPSPADEIGSDGRTVNVLFFTSDEFSENITLQNEIFGRFNTGSIRHNLLLGVDLAHNEFNYLFQPDRQLEFDIFDPEYGRTPVLIPDGGPFGREIVSNNVGIYAQNLVELLPNLNLLLGGRLDFNDYSTEDTVAEDVLDDQSNTRLSPRIGILYQPGSMTALYANWGTGFSPQFQARSRTDEAFDPTTSEQFEVGIRQDIIEDRLTANLALFQITRQNVLTPDPDDSLFSIQTGEQRSRGIEFDISGEILPGWRIIANYAYLDAEVTEDNVIPEGDRLYGVPEHSAGLWTTYEIQQGDLQGLGFGFGLYYSDEQNVALPNTFTVPSYVRLDAALLLSSRSSQGCCKLQEHYKC